MDTAAGSASDLWSGPPVLSKGEHYCSQKALSLPKVVFYHFAPNTSQLCWSLEGDIGLSQDCFLF